MRKHRKTHKEKVIADLRRQLYSFRDQNIVPSKPKLSIEPQGRPTASSILTNTYSYLLHDILKTGIITMSIVAIQVILFLIFKNHILKLPGVSY